MEKQTCAPEVERKGSLGSSVQVKVCGLGVQRQQPPLREQVVKSCVTLRDLELTSEGCPTAKLP